MRKFGNMLFAATGLLSLIGVIGLVSTRPAASTTGAPVPVTVSNSTISPVQIRDTDNGDRQAVQFLVQPDTNGTGSSEAESDILVPAGKRLVIEYLSAQLGTGNGSVTVETTVGGNSVAYYLIENTTDHNHKFFPTKIYADPGTNVRVFADSNDTSRVYADVEISGHYVNIP